MNITQHLIEDYPLVCQELIEYTRKRDHLQADNELDNGLLDIILRMYTARSLVDFFDFNEYYMQITRTGNKWCAFVSGRATMEEQFPFDTREEAEYECAVFILNAMEEKLAENNT